MFALGTVSTTETFGHYHRARGANGVFATTDSGATLAVLDAEANARLRARGPYSSDPVVHQKKVEEYFASAGLPADQLGKTDNLPLVWAQGSAIERQPLERKLIAWTTVINRALSGIRIEGSYAWACFNADGVVTAEEVYWPAIPRSVVADAIALKVQLALPSSASALAESAGPGYTATEVLVHHTPQTSDSFNVFAAVQFVNARWRV